MSDIDPVTSSSPSLHVLSERPGDGADDDGPEREERPERSERPASRPGDREGLPSSYRMRADAHYVDQLIGRKAEPARAPAAEPRVDPIDVADPKLQQSPRLLAELADQMAAIEAAVHTLQGPGTSLVRRAGIDVVASHAWRASWLIRAAAMVDGSHAWRTRLRQIGPLLTQVRERLASELRLRGCSLHVIASDWNASVETDDAAFVAALTGGVIATLGLAGDVEGTAVRLTIKTANGDLQSLEVVQDDVTVGEPTIARFFDAGWVERPGGWPAGVGAAAIRAFARQQGGRASLAGGRRGTTLRLEFDRTF